uniref:EF-hand domain-containing protein n=1 Tax=Oryza brachyantha TaxID=4533 RepID=J3M719_ORYBR
MIQISASPPPPHVPACRLPGSAIAGSTIAACRRLRQRRAVRFHVALSPQRVARLHCLRAQMRLTYQWITALPFVLLAFDEDGNSKMSAAELRGCVTTALGERL